MAQVPQIDLNQTFIEVKCLRITYPKPNLQHIPLNGLYEPITINPSKKQKSDNNILAPTPSNVPKQEPVADGTTLIKPIVNFNILPSTGPSVDNLFQLTTGFGRILLQENLKALIVIINKAKDNRDLILTNFRIKILSEPNSKESMPRQTGNQIVSKDDIILKANDFYSIRLNQPLENIGKYTIEIFTTILIKYKEPQYAKDRYGNPNKSSYVYVEKMIKKDFTKKLTFDSLKPFKITPSFSYYQMKKCQIEITILNETIMPLNVFDIYLLTDKNSLNKIEPIDGESVKSIVIQPNEELKLLFLLDNKEIYSYTPNFYLNIDWGNAFDSSIKYFKQKITNNLNIYHDDYSLSLIEAPTDKIYLGQNFKVVLEVQNKKDKPMKLEVSINKENAANDREVDVIDIVDNIIELKDKATFCLICKSDILGTVCLPKIKIVNQADRNKTHNLEKLLFFNCAKEINLI